MIVLRVFLFTIGLVLVSQPTSAQQGIVFSGGSVSSANGSLSYSVGLLDYVYAEAQGHSMSHGHQQVNREFCLLQVSANIVNPTCFNGADGSIQLTVTGGITPYSFQWFDNAQTALRTNLVAGTYTVAITDGAGCDTTIQYVVSNPTALAVSVNATQANCTQSDATATSTVTGGNAPYQYQWSSGDTLANASGLAAGAYMLSVYDNNGCFGAAFFNVNSIGGPVITSSVTHTTCAGDTDGAIALTVTGGTAPYSFAWSNGATTQNISNLNADAYQAWVTDASGCIALADIAVGVSAPIVLAAPTIVQPTCNNNDGSIVVNATGGTGTLNYLWNGGQTGSLLPNVPAGFYEVTISDINGCSITENYSLSNAGAPQVVLQSITPAGCGGNGSSIDVSVTSGTPSYTYCWNNCTYTTQDLNAVPPGLYQLLVTGGNGCGSTFEVILPGIMPTNPGICMVTVDTNTLTNQVVWEKPAIANGAAYYSIYREGNSAGVYTLRDTVHFNNLSQWTDPTANPKIRAWRYRITVTDSCGTESVFSPIHKTVHLTVNKGVGNTVNLIWDNYVGESFGSWYINRFHNSTGWVRLDTVPSNLQSYTDLNPPAQGGFIDYSIEGGEILCTATRAINHNTTRSNKQSTIADPTGIEDIFSQLSSFPNPTANIITLKGLLKSQTSLTVEFLDITGREVLPSRAFSGTSLNETYDMSTLSNGLYLIRISSANTIRSFQVVKM